jgi:hypothetical protein
MTFNNLPYPTLPKKGIWKNEFGMLQTLARKFWSSVAQDDEDGSKAIKIIAHGSAQSAKMAKGVYNVATIRRMAQDAKATTLAVLGETVPWHEEDIIAFRQLPLADIWPNRFFGK